MNDLLALVSKIDSISNNNERSSKSEDQIIDIKDIVNIF
jgi:hypothetical protein